MLKVTRRNRRAFTLMELLVVIAIVALLMSIMMPSLQKAKKMAQTVVCQTNLRQQGLAYAIYLQEYRGECVPFQDKYMKKYDRYWSHLLAPYIGKSKLEKGAASQEWNDASKIDKVLHLFLCPSQREKLKTDSDDVMGFNWRLRYGISLGTSSYWGYESVNGAMTEVLKKRKYDKMKNPSSVMNIADATDNTNKHVDPEVALFAFPKWRHYLTSSLAGYYIPVADRHSDTNILFADGHTGKMKFEEVMFLEKDTDILGRQDTDAERKAKYVLWNYTNEGNLRKE